jgi:DNA helicase-2/ATP-dependent DNA helicase PcrA
MQRIYADGKVDLGSSIPPTWAKPVKALNHRSPRRVIRLINRIRAGDDGQIQKACEGAADGTVRLFVVPNAHDKAEVEARVVRRMAEITGDAAWDVDERTYKTLILEHHMAAKRLGFAAMFGPLYELNRVRTGLLDGTLPGLRFFARDVLPLVEASQRGDNFAVAAIVRDRSPLLAKESLSSRKDRQMQQLAEAKTAVDALGQLWEQDKSPSFGDVLLEVYRSGLFEIPAPLVGIAASSDESEEDDGEDEPLSAEVEAWSRMLATPFQQIAAYSAYVSGESPFATHQGVKGLEFPRVLAIIDDADARGFMFSYDKLFGVKEKSAAELRNESEGGESSVSRTRRLFYVICSRSESSLAIVAYSDGPARVAERALSEGWFDSQEIELVE